jgi:hypothetical protein
MADKEVTKVTELTEGTEVVEVTVGMEVMEVTVACNLHISIAL